MQFQNSTMFHSSLNGVTVNLFPQKLTRLVNLYLADNKLEAVPFIPDNVRILHLQVCVDRLTTKTYTNLLI